MEAQRERNIIKRLRRDIYLEYIIKKYLEAACDNCFQIFTETSFVWNILLILGYWITEWRAACLGYINYLGGATSWMEIELKQGIVLGRD